MASVRDLDQPADDVYYFGLVNPAASRTAYCRTGCTLGRAYLADAPTLFSRAGWGVGFTGDESAWVMAHELGHNHGAPHAPCAVLDYFDQDYPYANGALGTTGYDQVSGNFYPSSDRRDVMGYCTPQWISDYNYRRFFERSEALATLFPPSPGWPGPTPRLSAEPQTYPFAGLRPGSQSLGARASSPWVAARSTP